MIIRASLIVIALAACGDSKNKSVDAPKAIDAAPATVVAVTCPANPAAMITAINTPGLGSFSPSSVMINVGQVVQFMMPANHNVVPNTTGMSDPGLMVNFNETKCLMFTAPGTFGFHCAPHSFQGTVTVQ